MISNPTDVEQWNKAKSLWDGGNRAVAVAPPLNYVETERVAADAGVPTLDGALGQTPVVSSVNASGK